MAGNNRNSIYTNKTNAALSYYTYCNKEPVTRLADYLNYRNELGVTWPVARNIVVSITDTSEEVAVFWKFSTR
ncbi:hypothetical protein Y1Q_0008525 [Alligator mississippiensis]|uniref:Uncharacterized protein n=1 Tax=Alligator mississippiensis TaxID=8496 RepID=A0A151M1M1_ALLMI|nr:hypothetical protein Y1Q_0008525 [Alligator mississippiensis]